MSEKQTTYTICDICKEIQKENDPIFFIEGALGIGDRTILPKLTRSINTFSGMFSQIYITEKQHICLKCMKNLIIECGESCE